MRHDALGLFWEDRPVVKELKVKPKRTPPPRTWEDPSYLPHIAEARLFQVQQYTEVDLWNAQISKEVLILDLESYQNYFCVGFKGLNSGKVHFIQIRGEGQRLTDNDASKLNWILTNFCTAGFNSNDYDLVILTLALHGCTAAQLKQATQMIIDEDLRPEEVLKAFKCKYLKGVDHIDLVEVAPSRCSLKLYGGRMHTKRMQDLPFAPATVFNEDQMLVTLWYCINDLDQTIELTRSLKEELELRVSLTHEYKIDLRSKSDAQIAEALIGQGIRKLSGRYPQRGQAAPGTVHYYRAPAYMEFQTDLMQWVLRKFTQTPFVVGEDGYIITPEGFDDFVINIAGKNYKLGLGGIHSQESSVSYFTTSTHILKEIDVTSFYPFIIINNALYPSHLGPDFLSIFEGIVYRRLDAKKKKNKKVSDSLKIVINGTFGKLGNFYSLFYEPDLLIKVTFTGQLTLLMLIEAFELNGIEVVSANTDGILTNCPRDKEHLMKVLVKEWERVTGFMMEDTLYKSVHKRDVNNYLAVKESGEVTSKGIFKEAGLQKNPTNQICYEAFKKFVCTGKPIAETLWECRDISKFVSVRTVKGGAVKKSEDGQFEYLGKAIRWYYAKDTSGEIVYALTGNKVPKSEGVKPLMNLPDQFPEDIDYDRYYQEALDLLQLVSYPTP
jgi:hypothetical protein